VTYDVLAARARRLEAEGRKPWPFTIGEDTYELPAEPPAELLPFLAELAPVIDANEGGELPTEVIVKVPEILHGVLGPEQAKRFNRHQLSIQDVAGLLMEYFEKAFGGGVPESAGSPGSSPTQGEPTTPKPTSKPRTRSTSSSTTRRRKS
jgi:hypothetical protein